jgi:type I restriction enzyme S subunit
MTRKVRRVGDVAMVFNGKTPSKAEQRDAGFPVLKIKDVSEMGQFRGVFASFVDQSLANRHSARWICAGDTLILNAAHNADYVGSKVFLAGVDVAGTLPTGEWLLVRSNQSEVLPVYMHYWLRSADAKNMIRFIVKGIHLYPKDVAEMGLPWMPLPEQCRIVDLLSRAEGIVRLRREAEKKAAELIPALFLDMFGDPATNPKGWPCNLFGTVGVLDRGRSRNRPRDAKELYGGPYPFIQTGDVANSGGRIRSYTATYSEAGLAQSRLWKQGTLCITIAANIAKTGVLEFDACFPDSVVGFLPAEQIRTAYAQAWLGFLQPTLEANAPQAAQKNINLEILRNLPIPLPPLALQEVFEQRCSDVISVQSQQSVATAKAQASFDALLDEAFAGRY